MRKIRLIVLLVLAGCQGTIGPARRGPSLDAVDDPRYSISEQEQRRRDRLALPDVSPSIGPRTYAEEPAYRGR